MVKKQNESLGKVGTPPRKTTSKATKSKTTVKNSSKQIKHNLCSGSIEVPVVSTPVVLVFDQIDAIGSVNLTDLGYRWNPFTWWNARAEPYCVWKHLDRALANGP
ncbi:hypothetical protein M9H77_35462 [Catharanthus roseus]|uniref:Uncharacterized protein n=1 Tax=Catharanthus roseus TaxID=4058 RepID=A0ACB9ZTC6_CATRO|nr:hypothetical protein M9H77_35462 [Catharanthus roseus]